MNRLSNDVCVGVSCGSTVTSITQQTHNTHQSPVSTHRMSCRTSSGQRLTNQITGSESVEVTERLPALLTAPSVCRWGTTRTTQTQTHKHMTSAVESHVCLISVIRSQRSSQKVVSQRGQVYFITQTPLSCVCLWKVWRRGWITPDSLWSCSLSETLGFWEEWMSTGLSMMNTHPPFLRWNERHRNVKGYFRPV